MSCFFYDKYRWGQPVFFISLFRNRITRESQKSFASKANPFCPKSSEYRQSVVQYFDVYIYFFTLTAGTAPICFWKKRIFLSLPHLFEDKSLSECTSIFIFFRILTFCLLKSALFIWSCGWERSQWWALWGFICYPSSTWMDLYSWISLCLFWVASSFLDYPKWGIYYW